MNDHDEHFYDALGYVTALWERFNVHRCGQCGEHGDDCRCEPA